jgi:putative endonuclease
MFPSVLLSRVLSLFSRRPLRMRGLRGVGQEWESVAEKRLKEAGYKIRARNFRTRVGEIDFVAEDGGVLCFIEVKGRHSTRFGIPEDAVNAEKQRRIFRASEAYLQRERLENTRCRFDVVAIIQDGAAPDVTILRDAFAGPPRPRRRR